MANSKRTRSYSTATRKYIEAKFGKSVKEVCHSMYYGLRMPVSIMAKRLDVSPSTIYKWFEEWGWPTKRYVDPVDVPVLTSKDKELLDEEEEKAHE